jgi:hypothetical protein
VFGPGDLRGEPAVLDAEKRGLIYRMYEVYPKGHEQAGRRRFKRCAISLRKGTAKTELAAWLAAVELHPDGPVRCDGFDAQGEPVGVPIGNLLSQLYALIYLNPLDHYIKRDLKVRHYARYVDDLVLIGLTREQAIDYRARIAAFLADRLHLESSRTGIARATRGLNFVGYRTWATRRFVRRHALYTFRRAARRGRTESIVSSLGHARRTASARYMVRYLQENHHGLYHQLPKSLRPVQHLSPGCA